MRLIDELNNIEQTDFTIQNKKQKLIEKYKSEIIKELKKLRIKGIKEYRTKVPCNIFWELHSYFKSEGIWLIYLDSNNITCRVLICPEESL